MNTKARLAPIHPQADAQVEARWIHQSVYLTGAIVEYGIWDRVCSTEAMRTILRFAFTARDLRLVSLNVVDISTWAMRVYEKPGVVEEGRLREFVQRQGRSWDLV